VTSTRDRGAGGLYGLLVGDAIGVPYEFHDAGAIAAVAPVEMEPPPGFRRAHVGVPPGTWSDDGAQALCLLASLVHVRGFDARDFANRLVNWHDRGYFAVDGRVFDVGMQTARAIEALRAGVPPEVAGGADEWENGNGSLMRTLPLALWHRGPDLALLADAERQSAVTHRHLRSRVVCAVYALWARRELGGQRWTLDDAVAAYVSAVPDVDRRREAGHLLGDAPRRGSGYVVDCLRSADVALREPSYEAVVRRAIAFGDDTDTTACVAGGIAGIRYGLDGIPSRWRSALRGQDLFAPLLAPLLA
jgi:ADP-ribosyl-[dinitrogen reductase] hydrolase